MPPLHKHTLNEYEIKYHYVTTSNYKKRTRNERSKSNDKDVRRFRFHANAL